MFIQKIKLALTLLAALAALPTALIAGPKVLLETTQGNITIELDAQAAPKTVANFLSYVDAGFYDGTVFHRVISGFMIQGGGMDSTLNPKATHAPITNEADNGLLNARGTIAMARTPDPHSASSQFFINLANNSFLNFRDKTPNGWGYAVFGRVIAGMETVDKIAALRTNMQDVPTTIPIIKHATRITTEDSK